jgi:hypothetical protein
VTTKKRDPASALLKVINLLDPLDESDKKWVLQSAASKWTIEVQRAAAQPPGSPGGGQGPVGTDTAKDFLKRKLPQSDLQRVACLAYFLTHSKSVHAFKTADISKLNTEARGTPFNVPRAVANANRATCGYLSAVGKGQKQLTAYGEEIVEALPDKAAVAAVEASRKSKKHKKRKKLKPKR